MDWTIRTPAPIPGEWPWAIPPASVVCRDVIECDPVPWSRAGRHGARTYTPRHVQDHEDLVKWRLRNAIRKAGIPLPLTDGLGLIAFFFVRTKTRRDRDNFLKLIQDAGNPPRQNPTAGIWVDDSQIVEGFERIFYDPRRPRTELLVYRVPA